MALFTFIGSVVVGELLRPKPKIENAKVAGRGDFQFPTASAARPIPVVWGTVKIDAPNLVWYGDLSTEPITRKVKVSMFKKKTQTTGHRYYLGMHLVLCHGEIDGLIAIKSGDKTAWEGNAIDQTIIINSPNLLGGDDKGGGLTGNVDIQSGKKNQQSNPYLQAQINVNIPAYRGVVSVIFSHIYIGTSTNLSPLSFVVRCLPNHLDIRYHDINGDANPIEMLFELLTNDRWGMGLLQEKINRSEFIQAAKTLHKEQFGMSLLWDNEKKIEDMIDEILRHVDGVLFEDMKDGRFVLKLARDDYNPESVPEFNPSNIIKLSQFSRSAWDETTNEVKITYPSSMECDCFSS